MALSLIKRLVKGSALTATDFDNDMTSIEAAVNAKADVGVDGLLVPAQQPGTTQGKAVLAALTADAQRDAMLAVGTASALQQRVDFVQSITYEAFTTAGFVPDPTTLYLIPGRGAWLGATQVADQTGTTAVTYVPPLDIASMPAAAAAYSVHRKLRAAYAGAAFQAVRVTGGTTQDIGFLSSGLVDKAALTTFANGSSVEVGILYDQSGNGRNITCPSGHRFRIANAGALDVDSAGRLRLVGQAAGSGGSAPLGATFASTSMAAVALADYTVNAEVTIGLNDGTSGSDSSSNFFVEFLMSQITGDPETVQTARNPGVLADVGPLAFAGFQAASARWDGATKQLVCDAGTASNADTRALSGVTTLLFGVNAAVTPNYGRSPVAGSFRAEAVLWLDTIPSDSLLEQARLNLRTYWDAFSNVVTPSIALPFGYGPGFWSDALQALAIGSAYPPSPAFRYGCVRFMAPVSGRLEKAFQWFQERNNPVDQSYSAGSGGIITAMLFNGSGGNFTLGSKIGADQPTGLLNTGLTAINYPNQNNGRWWTSVFSDTNWQLTAGNYYWLVYRNDDPDPANNWRSMECQPHFTAPPNGVPLARRFPNDEWIAGQIVGAGNAAAGATVDVSGRLYLPIGYMVINGTPQLGVGYTEPLAPRNIGADTYDGTIGGNNRVRQRFTVPAGGVTAARVRFVCTYRSGSGSLTAQYKQGATVLETWTITQAGVVTGGGGAGGSVRPNSAFVVDTGASDLGANNGREVTCTMTGSSRALTAGLTYDLELSAPAGTLWRCYGINGDEVHGFTYPQTFTLGFADYMTDGVSWSQGWLTYGSNRTTTDLNGFIVEPV